MLRKSNRQKQRNKFQNKTELDSVIIIIIFWHNIVNPPPPQTHKKRWIKCVHSLWMGRAAKRPSARQAAHSTGASETSGPSTSKSNPSWVHTLASRLTDGIQPLPAKAASKAKGLTTHSECTHSDSPCTSTQKRTRTHVNTTFNAGAYGVRDAHMRALVPTRLPAHGAKAMTQTHRNTHQRVSSH